MWDNIRARSLSNLVEGKVTLPCRSSSGFLINQLPTKNPQKYLEVQETEKSVAMATLLPDIAEKP